MGTGGSGRVPGSDMQQQRQRRSQWELEESSESTEEDDGGYEVSLLWKRTMPSA